MNKVICDVCGTSYPETASQCPICGCAKPENPASDGQQTYTYVKGGRFSEKNVRRRNKEKQAARAASDYDYDYDESKPASNKGLVIVIIILLLAIIAMLGYLYITYLRPDSGKDPAGNTTTAATTAAPTENSTTETTLDETQPSGTTVPADLSCTGIILTEPEITFDKAGDGYLLNFTLQPENTPDAVTFESSDPNVATVDSNGKITAVGHGTAIITVTCGDAKVQTLVTCNIPEPTTEPTTQPTETEPEELLNRTDITLYIGDSWDLYDGTVGVTKITWGSEDENVATIRYGTVTAISEGKTVVYAEYNGQRYECIIRVKPPKTN